MMDKKPKPAEDKQQKQRDIQAILFACGEPMELERLAQAVELTPGQTEEILREIGDLYRAYALPFEMVRLSGSVQMCALPQYTAVIRGALALRRGAPLSQAALEVLAIIAYNQPVTKSFVEQVRGVDSSGVINALVEKELVEEAGRLELPGRPISYRTTVHFLRCFSLTCLDDLPAVQQQDLAENADEEVEETQSDF